MRVKYKDKEEEKKKGVELVFKPDLLNDKMNDK